MNMWNFLEIEKTRDDSSIKSAFAKKRGVIPSQDAKMLSSAYEFAQRCAKIMQSEDSFKEELLLELAFANNWKQHLIKTSRDPESGTQSSGAGPASEVRPFKTPLYDEYYALLQKVYDNFFVRRELINWETLIRQNPNWSAGKSMYEPIVQDFLMAHRSLPFSVWQLFDNEFMWTQRIYEITEKNQEFARIFLIETCPRWTLDYSFVKRENVFDYENYFKYRTLMRAAALENNPERVRENFDFAIDIYTNDVRLYEIAADFYTSQPAFNKYGDFGPEFLHALNKLIKVHYDDSKYLRERAEYFKRCEYFEESRDDYEACMKLNPDDLRLPLEIAETFFIQDMGGHAKPYLKFIKKVYQKTQMSLEKQLSTASDRAKISALIDSNDAVLGEVYDKLK